jgi:hypothetical protein
MEDGQVPGEGLRELGVEKGGDVKGRGGPSVVEWRGPVSALCLSVVRPGYWEGKENTSCCI